jgi:hypothetical protein
MEKPYARNDKPLTPVRYNLELVIAILFYVDILSGLIVQ